jgi:hypothetical protein
MTEDANLYKDFQPIWCENCNQQGYIFMENSNQPALVVCSRCEYETSQVSCPNCDMRGAFVKNLVKKPNSWICDRCGTNYSLPTFFYENPVHLYLEDELPLDVFKRIKPIKVYKLFGPKNSLLCFMFLGVAITGIILLSVFRNQPLPFFYTFVVSIALLIILGYFFIRIDNPFYNPNPRIIIPAFIWLLLIIGEVYLMFKGTLLLAMCGMGVQAISAGAILFYLAFRDRKTTKRKPRD